MLVTQKHQYALRAVFELAKHYGQGHIKVSTIAERQAIPHRFLEVILNQLKSSGVVAAKRGFQGGYTLVQPPHEITVGQLFRFIDSLQAPGAAHCISCMGKISCPFDGDCAFMPMWSRVQNAIFSVYDTTTIERLLQDEAEQQSGSAVGHRIAPDLS